MLKKSLIQELKLTYSTLYLLSLDYVEQTGYEITDVVKQYGNKLFEITNDYINVVLPFDKEVISSKSN